MGKCLSKTFGCLATNGDEDALIPDTILSDDVRFSQGADSSHIPDVPITLPPFTAPSKKPAGLGLGLSLQTLPRGNESSDAPTLPRSSAPPPKLGKPTFPAFQAPAQNEMALNFESLDRSGETEQTRSQAKLDMYSRVCSEVTPYLFVGSDLVARDAETLEKCGITHIINAAGMVCDNYFEKTGKFEYLKVHLEDGAHEDIECVFYDMIDFLDRATDRNRNGSKHTAFVHCSQGVSRSTSICILYLMYVNNWNYDTAYQHVRDTRPITRPNPGFMCQLLAWHKRRTDGVKQARFYRVVSQSSYTPSYLVAKANQSSQFSSSLLDPETCCVLHTPSDLFVWTGRSTASEHRKVAARHAQRLQQFEKAPEAQFISQGSEPNEFWEAFSDGSKGFESRTSYVKAPAKEQVSSGLNNRATVPLADPESARTDEEKVALDPRMYASPDWEDIDMFDSDDLEEDRTFVLLPTLEDPQYAFVWVGESAEMDKDEALKCGRQCLESLDLDANINLVVVFQGSEDARFWKMFKNG